MKGSIPEDKIEEVRRRTDIVSLIGEYVTLKKTGKNYLGLCPFHREKTPSFTVSPDKQMFYCFGCSEGGNGVSFLMKLNNLTFPEAVRQLAGKVGVVIPDRPPSREERERSTLGEQIRRVNGLAADYFAGALQSPAGEGAREYLRNRGIGAEAISTFRLGFAPEGWRNLLDFLDKKGVPPKLVEQAGLAIPRAGEGERGHYDRFRGRLMIPIEDVDGHVIAFGGRVIGAGEPKYMNSPESPVYTKGNNLYGLSRTREAIRQAGFSLMVEGYFDLIALWSAGIQHVVATLGTALTRAQVDLLRRYAPRVAAVFDPDEAGRKALARSLELFLAGNVHAKAVILPDGHDPDDYVRTRGREKMEELVARALPMVDYYIEEILGGRGTLEEDRDKLREAVAFLCRIVDAVERNLFIKKVAETLNVDEGVLKAEIQRTRAHSPAQMPAEQMRRKAPTEYDSVEMSLVQMMLEYPNKISVVAQSGVLDCFRTGELKSLGEELLAASLEGGATKDASVFVGSLSEGPLRNKLLALLVRESPYHEDLIDRLMADAVRQLRERANKERGRILTRKINEAKKAGNQELHDRLFAEKNRLLREEKELS
ncbi:MAG: DNA primase [Syntrophales bacterium]|nr:DNA primase [Syntrophales bacterium]MDP3096846.1 DNA primase [Syntrophales bacterium]